MTATPYPSPFTARDLLCELFWPMLDAERRWLQMSSASNEYAQKARRTLAVVLADECRMTVEEIARFTGRKTKTQNITAWIAEARADKEIMGMAEAVSKYVKEKQGVSNGDERTGTDAA